MAKNIVVSKGGYTPVPELDVEIVERKGLGHPDTIIDGIMEEISVELCKAYLKEFGTILHHNVDKGQIVGGEAKPEFGGGKIIQPLFILLSGRASYEADGKVFPVQEIALETTKKYIQQNTRFLDPDADVEIMSKIRPGSKDLVELFLRNKGKVPLANDTSFGVGYAPFSDAEKVVLAVEKYLNSKEYKKLHPEVGEDIKVMGLRENRRIKLTVAVAFVDRFIHSIDEYVKAKERVTKDILKKAKEITDMDVEVFVNTADDIKNNSVYITVTGLSAEAGDDGSVGRGNRVNGLITPFRLMTLEAAAGKNPVSHVGKIYSVLAFKIAEDISKEYPSLRDVSVSLLSQIGKPINEPKMAFIELVGDDVEPLKSKARDIAEQNLENIEELTKLIVGKKVGVFY
ncbi:MAG: methionine adenosyltransferase [Candidatus Anstonellales archaeon]